MADEEAELEEIQSWQVNSFRSTTQSRWIHSLHSRHRIVCRDPGTTRVNGYRFAAVNQIVLTGVTTDATKLLVKPDFFVANEENF
jgi:hypothetical protein